MSSREDRLSILILAGNTLRARAYAQSLSLLNDYNFEVTGIFYGVEKRICKGVDLDLLTEKFLKDQDLFIPDFSEALESTFRKNKWRYISIASDDVNSDEIINSAISAQSDIVVFAGYGGQILGDGYFSGNIKVLHMHPGELPLERGSTTIYYSILNQRKCSVTAFYMSPKIDEGVNILSCKYEPPCKGVDIDYFYDNVIRADCFLKVVKGMLTVDTIHNSSEQVESIEYFIIHPVLKHLALLSLKEAEY